MNVYAVVSETMHDVSYDRMEEDWGCLAVIVAARTRGQARYLAVRSDPSLRRYGPLDWPRLWCKRLGKMDGPAGVLPGDGGDWWGRCPDGWPKGTMTQEPGE